MDGWASCLRCRGFLIRFGHDRNGNPRAKCKTCGTFTTNSNPFGPDIRSPRRHELAREYLLRGESIRSTAQILGISKGTVQRALNELGDLPIKCGCGGDARHRGWCAVRVARSPLRQSFLARWGRAKDWPSIESRPRRVPVFCVGAPDLRTAIAIERACLRSGVLDNTPPSIDDYFKATNEIWKAAHRLGCNVCGTYRKYGGRRCRRCTRLQTRIREAEIVIGGSVSYPIWQRQKAFEKYAKLLADNRFLSPHQRLIKLLQWKPEESQN